MYNFINFMSKQPDNYQTTEQSQPVQQEESNITLNSKAKKQRKQLSHGRFDNYQQALWKESPNSLTRDRAPSHRIPKAQRFGPKKIEGFKFNNFLTIQHYQTETDPMNKTGVSFCRSTRPQHFVKEDLINPSPASYRLQRFLDTTQYKAKTEVSQTSLNKKSSEIKGGVIKQFQNQHKSYVPHSKHRNYQPENIIDNPAPNHYCNVWKQKHKQIKYTFRAKLKKFNQSHNNFPGPTSYRVEEQRPSFNVKGTFQQSKRTYLTKLEQGPASNQYNIVRFLQRNQ